MRWLPTSPIWWLFSPPSVSLPIRRNCACLATVIPGNPLSGLQCCSGWFIFWFSAGYKRLPASTWPRRWPSWYRWGCLSCWRRSLLKAKPLPWISTASTLACRCGNRWKIPCWLRFGCLLAWKARWWYQLAPVIKRMLGARRCWRWFPRWGFICWSRCCRWVSSPAPSWRRCAIHQWRTWWCVWWGPGVKSWLPPGWLSPFAGLTWAGRLWRRKCRCWPPRIRRFRASSPGRMRITPQPPHCGSLTSACRRAWCWSGWPVQTTTRCWLSLPRWSSCLTSWSARFCWK